MGASSGAKARNAHGQQLIELEDILRLPQDEAPTLSLLDATLRRFMALCATYHGTCDSLQVPMLLPHRSTEQYLQSPLQLEHACNLLLESELFEFHSERMLDIIIDDAQTVCSPSNQMSPLTAGTDLVE